MQLEPDGSFCVLTHNVFGLKNVWRRHGEGMEKARDVPLAVFSRNKLFNKPIEGVLGQKCCQFNRLLLWQLLIK